LQPGAHAHAAGSHKVASEIRHLLPLVCFQFLDDRLSVVADFGNRIFNLKARFFQALAPMTRHILAGHIDAISRWLRGWS